MYLHEWREGEEARTVKKVTLQNMADKFGASNGSVVRRWMLPAYDKDFNFPDHTTILNIKYETFGEVSPEDWFRWVEETQTEPEPELIPEPEPIPEEIVKIDLENITDEPQLLDTRQATKIIWQSSEKKYQQRTVRLVNNGQIKTKKIGKKNYFTKSEILRFLS